MVELLALISVFCGLFFFLSGSVGLLRLPDLFCRLHALAKADNVGLALIALGVMLIDGSLVNALKITLVWLLVMAASSVSSHLIARNALRGGSAHD
jgi:multicomponent Na+:H+ antiporter subunit G